MRRGEDDGLWVRLTYPVALAESVLVSPSPHPSPAGGRGSALRLVVTYVSRCSRLWKTRRMTTPLAPWA
ncbi:hypothetical protein RPPS3_13590 [Rhodopseudomonas palustris]|nr:hypothetical protein RPPS3_13590 [Rhodopseudomonas palustris]